MEAYTQGRNASLKQVSYTFQRTFEIVKPDEQGNYPPIWFPASQVPDPAQQVLIKVDLHILWQEQRFVLDLNEVFDVDNCLIQMSKAVPNNLGANESNIKAVREMFAWLAEITTEAERIMKTADFGFLTHYNEDQSTNKESQPLFRIMQVSKNVKGSGGKTKTYIWNITPDGQHFVEATDGKTRLQYSMMIQRIKLSPEYKIKLVDIPTLSLLTIAEGSIFNNHEVVAFKFDKKGTLTIHIMNAEEWPDDFDETIEITIANIPRIGKLLFPNYGKTLDNNK